MIRGMGGWGFNLAWGFNLTLGIEVGRGPFLGGQPVPELYKLENGI